MISPILDMYRITAENMQSNSLSIPVQICGDTNQIVETLALFDSGAGGKFIDQAYVWNLGIKAQKLEQPLIARNVDGMPKKSLPLLFSTWLLNQTACYRIRKATDHIRLSMVKGTKP